MGEAGAAPREGGGDGQGKRWRGEHAGGQGGSGGGRWRDKQGSAGNDPPAGKPKAQQEEITAEVPTLKPGTVYVLRAGKPARVPVMTGLGDGAAFEIESDGLKPGDAVIVGLEQPVTAQNRNLQPPPGMGGPTFRGPGGGGGRARVR